jgi:hypothetical protein
MQSSVMKALAVISRQAAIAQGNKSFGKLRPKIGGDESLGIEDGDELGEGAIEGRPAHVATPGQELNASAQEHVLAQQDHQLPDDGWLPGAMPDENEPEPDEKQAPKSAPMGFMSTNSPKGREGGIQETAKRRRGRPRGSRA